MAGEAAAAMLAVQAVQLLLTQLETNLAFSSYLCPVVDPIDTITKMSFDYIIVGGGTAGAVMANRLSACSDAKVLMLEAGGCPPFESTLMGYFTLQPQSVFDYNMTSTNDGYSCQNLKDGVVGLTTGKMLGGSSSNQHGIYVRGASSVYDKWAEITSDSTWSYDSLLPYFIKAETVNDAYILAENGTYCGTNGPIKLQRQVSPTNVPVMKAFEELGYASINNTNADVTSGVITEPLLTIGDNIRQSTLSSYIYPVKDRSNLYVLTGAQVTKLNFGGTRPLERVTGVTFTYNGVSYTVSTTNEVIVSAGAILTPQLLMLSGVGPSDHLTEMGITTVIDLPVGDNMLDHTGVVGLLSLQNDNSTTSGGNPFEFPVPVTCSYINLTDTTSQTPEFQNIKLVFPHENAGLLQLCVNVFKFSDDICDAMYAASVGKQTMFMVANLMEPNSRGSVRLASTDSSVQPTVISGIMSNSRDLDQMAKFLAHTTSIVNTTYYTSTGARFNDLGLCTDKVKFSTEFWKCYSLAMSSTMWHYAGTAAMGSVVDSNLLVKGTANLRVVDASVIPVLPTGNIMASVIVIAEKISDVIISERSSCTTS